MKKYFRAAIVAALVAPTFAAAVPHASADEVTPVLGGSNVEVFVPKIISLCVRVDHTCTSKDN
jgi:hypothetical protein